MNAKTEFEKKQDLKFKSYISGPVFGFIFYFFLFCIFTIITHIVLRYGSIGDLKNDIMFQTLIIICVPINLAFLMFFFTRKFRERVSLRGSITFSLLLFPGLFLLINIYKTYGLELF